MTLFSGSYGHRLRAQRLRPHNNQARRELLQAWRVEGNKGRARFAVRTDHRGGRYILHSGPPPGEPGLG